MIDFTNPFIKPLIEYSPSILNELEMFKKELKFFKNTPRYNELLKMIINNWNHILNDKIKNEINILID